MSAIKTFEVPYRHLMATEINRVMQWGDILVRLSDTRAPFGIPFSAAVAWLTDSEWSHASLMYSMRTEDDAYSIPFVLEVSDRGAAPCRFIDWMDFCVGGRFALYRDSRIAAPSVAQLLYEAMGDVMARDPDYDFIYSDPEKLYCVEAVAQIYAAAGAPLADPMLIRDVLGPFEDLAFSCVNSLIRRLTGKGFNPDYPGYFVGSLERGMLSTRTLKLIAEGNGQTGEWMEAV